MEENNVDNQQKEFKLDYSLNSVQRISKKNMRGSRSRETYT